MDQRRDTIAARARRAAIACCAALALTVVMTWPLARGLDRLGRTTTMDGLYSIWNVAWVAHALVSDPLDLFDANIFYPHRDTLAYSESNIVAGIVAIPAWLATHNAYAAHNTAVLFAFTSTLLATWLLARRLTENSAAAAAAAVLFAFCPYFFSHTPHIQLLMAGGIPLSMLALHRLVDEPSPGRGVALGVALAVQALACAYYGIFAGLMVGYGVVFFAVSRQQWRAPRFWMSVAIAAVIAWMIVLPFFLPYLELRRSGEFGRLLDEARRYSATWPSYLVSSAHAHRTLLALARSLGWRTSEVLLPGILAIGLGTAGVVLSLRRKTDDSRQSRDRETVLLYGSIGVLAFWGSFGPAAGLYTLLYRTVPLLAFLRAPSRFGLLVPFVLAVFSALALRRLPAFAGRRTVLAAMAVVLLAVAELNLAPFPWERAIPVSRSYEVLAGMPRGVVAEFPFYGERVAYPLHAQYMVLATTHWMPLVNGYSDYIPPDFRETAFVLDSFPSTDTFAILQKHRVRYIGVHWDMYGPRAEEVRKNLESFAQHLRPLSSDTRMSLYEIVSFP
jgi:4-amino-4-deoxy-L-arabinose transferase-like glycosyltransferase